MTVQLRVQQDETLGGNPESRHDRFIPRDSVPAGHFDVHEFAERPANLCYCMELAEVLRQEGMNPGERPGDGTIPRAAIEIWLGRRSRGLHLFLCRPETEKAV